MKVMKHINRNLFFKRFLVSYLLILVLPILFSSFVYNEALKLVEQDARESRMLMLRHTRDMVDRTLKEIDKTIVDIMYASNFNNMMYMSPVHDGSPEVYKIWRFANEIQRITVSKDILNSTFYVFFNSSSLIFSHDTTNTGFENFYKNVCNYESVSYDQWYNTFFNNNFRRLYLPSAEINLNSKKMTAITCLTSLNLGSKNENGAVIAFLISDNKIKELMAEVNINNSGWVSITDESGRLIVGVSNEKYNLMDEDTMINISELSVSSGEGYFNKVVNGEEMIFIYTHSMYNDWIYTVALPVNTLMGKVRYVRNTALIVAVISLLSGLAISFILAYRNSKPVKDVISALREFFYNGSNHGKYEEDQNEVAFLQGGVSRLISNNKSMQDMIQRQVAALKTTFLDRLLKGEFDDEEKMNKLLCHISLDLKGKNYMCIVLMINRHDHLISSEILGELDVLRALVEDILHRSLQGKGHAHVLNENEMALLLVFDSENREDCVIKAKNIIQEISTNLIIHYHVAPVFGVGNIYEHAMGVSNSFNEASQALKACCELGNSQVLWFENMKKTKHRYYYPLEMEFKLVNMAKSGKHSEVEKVLDIIYVENFVRKKVDRQLARHLIMEMQATVLKLCEGMDNSVEFEKALFAMEIDKPEKAFTEIRETYMKICMLANEQKRSHNDQLAGSIIGYLNTNYSDPNLCVSVIASYFNLSDSYFSQFFKEQVGETFGVYLEKLRIQRACELLENNELMADVAQKVGYNSVHSFRRAFKKVMGVVPSEYKKFA